MSGSFRTRIVAMSALALLAMRVSAASATTIYADSFSSIDGTTGTRITGRTPETDLPGGKYTANTGSENFWGAGILSTTGNSAVGSNSSNVANGMGNPTPAAQLSSDEQEALAITGGATTLKTTYLISGDLYTGTLTDDTLTQRGDGLGFFTTVGASAAANFYGLSLHIDGSVSLVVNGTTPVGGAQKVAYPGTFIPSAFHTLTYTINTSTGAISNVKLDGNAETFTTTAFTAVTSSSLAGFYISSSTGPKFGNVDNFFLTDGTPVPEPASLGLSAMASLGILSRRRKPARS